MAKKKDESWKKILAYRDQKIKENEQKEKERLFNEGEANYRAFSSDFNKFLDDYATYAADLKNIGYSDMPSAMNRVSGLTNDLSSRANKARSFVEQNADLFDAGYAEEYGASITNALEAMENLRKAYQDKADYFGTFLDEEDYNASKAPADVLRQKIAELETEKQAKSRIPLSEQKKARDTGIYSPGAINDVKDLDERINRLRSYEYYQDNEYARRNEDIKSEKELNARIRELTERAKNTGDQDLAREAIWLQENKEQFLSEGELRRNLAITEEKTPYFGQQDDIDTLKAWAEKRADEQIARQHKEYMNREYYSLAEKPDFEDRSAYKGYGLESRGNPVYMEGRSGFAQDMFADYDNADYLYDYLNGKRALTSRGELISGTAYDTPDAWKRGLDNITDKEVKIFNTFYNENRPDKAMKFIEDLDLPERAYKRRMDDAITAVSELGVPAQVALSAASVALAPIKGVSLISDALSTVTGNKVNRNDILHFAGNAQKAIRDGVSGDMGEVGKFLYNTGLSIGDFLFTAAITGGFDTGATKASEWYSLGLMGAGAGADAFNEAIDRGLDQGSALATGVCAGIAEILFEKLSIENLPMFASGAGGAGWDNFFMNLVKQSFTEGSEEFFTDIANAVSDVMVNGTGAELIQRMYGYITEGMDPSEARKAVASEFGKQLFESFAGGTLSGMAVGSAAQIPGIVQNRRIGKAIERSGQTQALEDIVSQFADETVQQRYAEYNEAKTRSGKPKAGYTGALYTALDQAGYENLQNVINAQTEASVRERLQERNIQPSDDVVKAATSYIYGDASEVVENTLESAGVKDVVKELAKDATASRTPLESEAVKTAAEKVKKTQKIAEKTIRSEEMRKAAKENYNVARDGADIEKVVVNKNGDMAILQEDGSLADAKGAKVDLETATALAYAENMSPAARKEFFAEYRENISSKVSLDDYHTAFDYALTAGINALGIDRALDNTSGILSPESAKSIYEKGLDIRTENKAFTQEQTEAINAIRKELGISNDVTPGKVDDSVVRYRKLAPNDRRRAVIGVARVIAASTGRNITFYDSTAKARKKGISNGYYDAKRNTIYIDVNAGISELAGVFSDTMLPTLSHELVHIFAVDDVEGYNLLRDLVLDALVESTGKSKERLISEEIKRINEKDQNRLKGKSEAKQRAIAEEEIVARACEDRLANSRLMKAFIDEMENKESGLAQKFSNLLGRAIAKLKAVFQKVIKGYSSNAPESKAIRSLTDKLEAIQAQYDALLERRGTGAQTKAEDSVKVSASEQASAESASVEIDPESASAYSMLSERTWTESEYVQNKSKAADALAAALGVSKKTALKYINDVNSVARMIADDRVRLDYEASPFGSAFVSNVEYGGSFDFSTICKKRRLYTGTFQEIQKLIPNDALTADEILTIRNMMIEKGLEATCGLCYVEGSRADMGKFSKEFIRLYKRDNPEAWIPNMVDVNTPDGVEQMRINHPEAYAAYEYFWNHYGKLRDSDKALFASQQKPKLYESRKEYKGEVLTIFAGDTVITKNKNGGIRMQSFSDFEIVHMIDTMQIIMDMARVGLAGQAYTKVPAFADAFGNTGLKINLSLIAKGVDENGQIIFDDREGMNHDTAFALRDKYSKNVGTILVTFTDEQLYAAMSDPRVDFIIPFHRSQWKKSQYSAMGLPKGTKDYTFMQNEKYIKPQYHEYRGRQVLDKAKNYMPNEYWDFSKSGKENAEDYLRMCAENNKRPKLYKLLDDNGDGSYSLKKDGSTDGYWKLLIDFKMYDNNGKGSKQMPVKPNFSMDEIRQSLNDYEGGHGSFPVAYDVVDQFMESRESKGTMYQDRGNGYYGYSMSNNAVSAYENGEMPISKWTKTAIVSAVSKINPEAVQMIEGVSLKTLRANLLEQSSWHHTSKMYNRTNFYSINESAVEDLTAEQVEEWARNPETKAQGREYRGDIEYLEWSGTSARRKATERKLTDVNIEERGSFYYVTDDDGNLLLKKKIGSNGTVVTDYEAAQRFENEKKAARQRFEIAQRAAQQKMLDAATPAARELLNRFFNDGYESSQSGNLYAQGRKPSQSDYVNGIENYFKPGEQRITRDENGTYHAETWNGSEWEAESQNRYSDRVTSAEDARYLELAKDPEANKDELDRMVEEAASRAMPYSEIRLPNGKLRKVYHGTNSKEFSVFDNKKIGSANDLGWYGRGFYFAYSSGEASYYGNRIIPAFLDIRNPFNYEKELSEYKGQSTSVIGDMAAFAINLSEKFPILAADLDITVYEYTLDGRTRKRISLPEYANQVINVFNDEKLKPYKTTDRFGNSVYCYEYGGNLNISSLRLEHKTKEGAEKRRLDAAAGYVNEKIYGDVDVRTPEHFMQIIARDFTDTIKKLGYDGIIQSEDGDEAIAFTSFQIKSADPVTYDDDGNVIPLSERFNPEENDIRYQDRAAEAEGYRRVGDYYVDSSIKLTHNELTDEQKRFLVLGGKYHSVYDKGGEGAVYGDLSEKERTALESDPVLAEFFDAGLRGVTPKYRFAVRFRDIPENYRSKNYKTGEMERAVSAVNWLDEEQSNTPYDSIYARYASEKSIIGGWDLGLRGSDGEPLVVYPEKVTDYANRDAVKPVPVDDDIRYQDRTVEETESVRDILADALVDIAETDEDRSVLEDYRSRIGELNDLQAQRDSIKDEIRNVTEQRDAAANRRKELDERIQEMADERKPVDAELDRRAEADRQSKELSARITELREEANALNDKIVRADKKLLDLESTAPLQNVLKAAEKKAEARTKKHAKQIAEQKKERLRRTELRRKIGKIRADFQRALTAKNDSSRYIPPKLARGIIEICEAIDPTGSDPDTGSAQKYRTGLDALARLKLVYDSLENEKDSDYQSEFDKEFSSELQQLAEYIGDTPLRNMSLHQLELVYGAIHDISDMVRFAKQQIGRDEAISNYEVGQNIIDTMGRVDRLGLNREKAQGLKTFSRNWFDNAIRAVREMAGYDEDSELIRLFNDLNEGRKKADQFRMDASKELDALRESKADQKAYSDAVEKPVDFGLTDEDGNDLPLTKMQAFSILATYKREQMNPGRAHLETPVLIPDAEQERKGNYDKAIDRGKQLRVTDRVIRQIESKLTEWDKAYLAAAEKFFNETAKDAINETTMVLRHRPVATENYYFPYEVNDDYIPKENENISYNAAIANAGIMKNVVRSAKQQIVIRGMNQAITKHMNTVADIYGIAIPVRNFNKAFNMKQTDDDGGMSVKDAITRTWGKASQKLIGQAVADMQSPRKSSRNAILDNVRSAFVVSTLANNLSVWMKQAASYFTAGSVLTEKALRKGLYDYLTKVKDGVHAQDVWDEIDAHTSQHWIRRQGLSMPELGDLKQSKGWQNRLNEKLGKWSPMNWIQSMDVATTAALWYACKREAQSQGFSVKKDADAYWSKVTALYEQVLEDTQPMYDPLHRADITKDPGINRYVMFQTQPLQNTGIVREAAMRYKADKRTFGKNSAEAKTAAKNLRKALASQFVSQAVFTAMTLASAALLHRMNPFRDEDEDLTASSVGKNFITQLAKNDLNVILPVVGSYATFVIEHLFSTSQSEVISDPAVDKINGTIDIMARTKKNPSFKNLSDAFCEVASYFGIPAKNAYNIINGIYSHIQDGINGEFLSFEYGVERTNKQEAGHLFRLYDSGEAEEMEDELDLFYARKVESRLVDHPDETEDEALKAVKQSFRATLKARYAPLYIAAYEANDKETMQNIREFLKDTKAYTDAEHLNDVLYGWTHPKD